MKQIAFILISVLSISLTTLAQATPSPSIKWSSDKRDAILIFSTGPSAETFHSCLSEGFLMENRFELEVCKVRKYWMDDCSDSTSFIRTVGEDPVTGRLSLREDTIGDGEDPEERLVDDKSQALSRLRSLPPVSLESLGITESEKSKLRITLRVIEGCRGSYSSALRRISKVLTLGVVDIRGIDSGWINFPLANETDRSNEDGK